jgi:hypothetical protein
MSIGSLLVGIAVLLIVVAYLARPFRPTDGAGVDRTIEAWVSRVQASERVELQPVDEEARRAEGATSPQTINYCPQCGRPVDSDDRFCSGCGTQLRSEIT